MKAFITRLIPKSPIRLYKATTFVKSVPRGSEFSLEPMASTKVFGSRVQMSLPGIKIPLVNASRVNPMTVENCGWILGGSPLLKI